VLALRPGSALVVRVTEMTPPRVGQPAPPGPGLTLQAGQMTFIGTVLGSTLAGQPIIDSPLGLFTLGAKVEVAAGTRLGLQVLPPPGTGGPAMIGDQPASLAELSRRWAALDEALAALKASDPATARTVLEQTIARPGSQLAGGLAFFLAALRGGGDARRWLGENPVQALEKSGRGKLVQRLSEEMQEMARAGSSESAQPGEWRPLLMPVFDNGGISQLRLYVQRDGGKEDSEDGEPTGKRFMVDADFTRLGLLQLDGLVSGKRFDLVVRTTAALPDDLRKSINAIYTRSMDTAGFSGQLRFEAMPKLPTPDPNTLFGHAAAVSA
jgi:hypothetical protein